MSVSARRWPAIVTVNVDRVAILGLTHRKGRSHPGRIHVGLQSQNDQLPTGNPEVGRSVRTQTPVHKQGCIEETGRLAGCQMAGLEEDGT